MPHKVDLDAIREKLRAPKKSGALSHLPPLLSHAQLTKALTAPLPEEALRNIEHNGMTEIIPQYEIERLNNVFGFGGWHDEYSQETCRDLGPGGYDRPLYEASCKCVLTIPRYGIRHEQNGGQINSNRGDAEKSAKTDALGKCCSLLGIGGEVYKRLRVAAQNMPEVEVYGKENFGLSYSRRTQYVYVRGVITEVIENCENVWIRAGIWTCMSPRDLWEKHPASGEAQSRELHAHALWEFPKSGKKFLRIVNVMDLHKFEPLAIPELRPLEERK